MAREIKFDLIYKGDHAFHHKKYHIEDLMAGIEKICDIHSMMELVVKRQYIGREDKNGIEIYEGDVIFIGYNRLGRHEVKFIRGSFTATRYDLNKCEVIGNIYEHPHLLEQGNG